MPFFADNKIILGTINPVHMHVRVGHQPTLQDANSKQIQVNNLDPGRVLSEAEFVPNNERVVVSG